MHFSGIWHQKVLSKDYKEFAALRASVSYPKLSQLYGGVSTGAVAGEGRGMSDSTGAGVEEVYA